MARILVTGGAGYVGAPCARLLCKRGHEVHTLDNLSEGHREAVSGPLHEVDLRDVTALTHVLQIGFDAVVHFAARSRVGESMRFPAAYHAVNVQGTRNLLNAMHVSGSPVLVFSSSAAVYGAPQTTPIHEDAPRAPVNPYGTTKLLAERMLEADPVRSIRLRYFNAAGATPDGALGEAHTPETHLIPRALEAASSGQPITMFGTTHPTRDGTCLRDYVHVDDLARAHALALEQLLMGHPGTVYNLGTGHGATVREVLATVERVSGQRVPVKEAPARVGDPPALVANIDRAQRYLRWHPRHDLRTTLAHAWAWHQAPRYR